MRKIVANLLTKAAFVFALASIAQVPEVFSATGGRVGKVKSFSKTTQARYF